MQIPVLNGMYTDSTDFRTSYPVNMVPVPKSTGISQGYLKPADGIAYLADGIGESRGGINWNGVLYRVMGTKLVKIDDEWNITIIGDVGFGGRCAFDYSFDYLAIVSGERMYLYDGTTLAQVTDVDLGKPISVRWIDGYFMVTDGTYLIVTELGNPFDINPLKYGTSEIDPDPIMAIQKIRNEIHAVNRYTIEVFDNVGGEFFPFERIEGAQIQKGSIGPQASCVFSEAVAFIGSGRGEPPGIYLGANASLSKISTREVDTILLSFTESQLSTAVLETRVNKNHVHLWVRLPDRTLVYDLAASQVVGEPVWHQLTSTANGFTEYRGIDLVWCYDKWLVCDTETGAMGYMTDETARHFGNIVRWEFNTAIVYNEARGAIFNALELICLSGRCEEFADPYISASYSSDGMTWSQERAIRAGGFGDRTRRLAWFQQGRMANWRIQRFRGDSTAMLSVIRLEATLEPLAV